MDARGNADTENTNINETLLYVSGLKEKVKNLCKLSQEKHVLRMVLARSKVITQRRLPGSPKKLRTTNIENKEVLDRNSQLNANENLQTVSKRIKSAPKEATVKETPSPSLLRAHKVKSQGFLFRKNSLKKTVYQRNNNLQKKANVFSTSTPKNPPKTNKDNFPNVSNIKECKTSSLLGDTDKDPKKISKIHSIVSNDSKTVENKPRKTITSGSKKVNKKIQDTSLKSPVANIPKMTNVPPRKKTKPLHHTSELSPRKEITKKRETSFIPSYLTSYELSLGENEDKVVEIEDDSNNLYKTCDDTFSDMGEENTIKKENKIDSLKNSQNSIMNKSSNNQIISKLPHVKEHQRCETPARMANKVLKYSEWRKISSSYPSPVSESRSGSLGMSSSQKFQSEMADLLATNSNTSTTKYLTPHSYDSEINLSVGDLSIEQVDQFKVNADSTGHSKFHEYSKKLDNGASTDLANKRKVCDKKSPKNDIGKSVSEPNKLLAPFQEGCRSQTWINFAKLFAENVRKARDQKKLREMCFERPVLNLAGDTNFSPVM